MRPFIFISTPSSGRHMSGKQTYAMTYRIDIPIYYKYTVEAECKEEAEEALWRDTMDKDHKLAAKLVSLELVKSKEGHKQEHSNTGGKHE